MKTSVLDSTFVVHSPLVGPRSGSLSALLACHENVISKCLQQWIVLCFAETKMQVPPPALGGLETAGDIPQLSIQVLHRLQVGIQSLAFIEPFFLALMTAEHIPFLPRHRFHVDKVLRQDKLAERIPVWSSM